MVQHTAFDCLKKNIRINCVAPGTIETPFMRGVCKILFVLNHEEYFYGKKIENLARLSSLFFYCGKQLCYLNVLYRPKSRLNTIQLQSVRKSFGLSIGVLVWASVCLSGLSVGLWNDWIFKAMVFRTHTCVLTTISSFRMKRWDKIIWFFTSPTGSGFEIVPEVLGFYQHYKLWGRSNYQVRKMRFVHSAFKILSFACEDTSAPSLSQKNLFLCDNVTLISLISFSVLGDG